MKIQITQSCYVDGKACKVGDVVDSAKSGLLIGIGKAKAFVEAKREPVKEPVKAEAKPVNTKAKKSK